MLTVDRINLVVTVKVYDAVVVIEKCSKLSEQIKMP